MLSQPPDNLDRWIEVSLGARNNAWSKGLLSLTELASALGENIEEVLSSDGRVLASRDPLELIRRVRDPALIFQFSASHELLFSKFDTNAGFIATCRSAAGIFAGSVD
jgi:hypothetical protein